MKCFPWFCLLALVPALARGVSEPRIVGEPWQIAGDPDLGDLTHPNQQPVDFGLWKAADGTWQLWSCIRGTKETGRTRLFHRWESDALTRPDWRPLGIAMRADPDQGETPGGLQAPHVIRHEGTFYMFYGDWENIRLATSQDGKTFQRARSTGAASAGLFTEGVGNNTRDPMVLRIGGLWHCYYTAYPEKLGSVYCRTSEDFKRWTPSRQVAFGGAAGTNAFSAECPFVVELVPGEFYLFRTQRYGRDAITRVYHSRDPFDFGVVRDVGRLVSSLPVAAPELVQEDGQWFMASLLPSLKGIQVSRLEWAPVPHRDWPAYLGDKASTQFSELAQISKSNVHQLEVAWTYHSGDARKDNRSQIQCNPLIIGGRLFGTSPQLKLLALDAATGRELWRFDPFAGAGESSSLGVNRGVMYWAQEDDQRLFFTAGHYLHAINARTGQPIPGFGDKGRVDIREGLGRDPRQLFVLANTPGVIYQDLLILGTRVSEGPGPSAPGDIRAYDVRTGQLIWNFRSVPHPGEAGYETWPPDAWRYIGGANCWTGMAVDEQRGLVFCPTGSAAFDFWGGNRIGQNLYANCLLALDARTGRRVWHFQFVHHDLWDRDLPAPPNLVTVQHNGRKVDAVAQVTKSGHVFVFQRETGEPLFPIEERPVPPSDLQGEAAWPTQPLPSKPAPFSRQLFSADQITDISPDSYKEILAQFVRLRPHAAFMPPSTEGTIIFPGFDGGGEWGGAAVDPRRGILYVNGNEMPWILTMVPTQARPGQAVSSGQQIYSQICAACHGLSRSGDPARAYPTLVNIGQKLKKTEIIELLGHGRGNMPAFTFLSAPQKEAVSDFLLETEAASGGIDRTPVPDATIQMQTIEPYTHTGYNRWLDTNGYPAVKPPWGTLNAIDLNTGDYLWKTTLGEFPELTARGIPPTGTENYGGPVVTAGGLVFIAASKDEMIRAFDQDTGQVLWQRKLPAGGYATPATYSVKGRQYVVIACGGGKMGTKSGDAYVAFALP